MSSRLQQGIIAALVVLNVGFIGWRLTDDSDAQLAALTGPVGGPGMGGPGMGGQGAGGPGMGGPGMGGPGAGGPGMGGPGAGGPGMGGPGAGGPGALTGDPGAATGQAGVPAGGGAPPPGYSAEDLFPIAGMPDWTGSAAEACPTLERFITMADAKLAAASAGSPLTAEARAAVLSGGCTLAEPAVKRALEPYRGAFGQAGLRPLPPFLYFGEDAPAAAPPQ